jgi:hypothetical protein
MDCESLCSWQVSREFDLEPIFQQCFFLRWYATVRRTGTSGGNAFEEYYFQNLNFTCC